MARLEDTAYPRLKSHPTPHDLAAVYTPSWDEIALANTATTGLRTRVCFLVLLKAYQRVGYPIALADVPAPIVEQIARAVGVPAAPLSIAGYDDSGTRQRHLSAIRAYLQVAPWGPVARRVMLGALREAARTKNDLADLINAALDELVHQRYELPAFDTLDRAARHVRAAVNHTLYRQVSAALTPQARATIDALFIADLATRRTPWNDLKAEPGRPTITHLQELLARQHWIAPRNVGARALADVPPVKVRHLAAEAMTLDAARMGALEPHKRATLAAALLFVRAQQALDDVGAMFTRQMRHIHNAGKAALVAYRAEAAPRTDALVGTLRDLGGSRAGGHGRGALRGDGRGHQWQGRRCADRGVRPASGARRQQLLPLPLAPLPQPPRDAVPPARQPHAALDHPGDHCRGSRALPARAYGLHGEDAAHGATRTEGFW